MVQSWLSKNRDDWLKNDIKFNYEAPEERMQIFMAMLDEERLQTINTRNNSNTYHFDRYGTLTRLT